MRSAESKLEQAEERLAEEWWAETRLEEVLWVEESSVDELQEAELWAEGWWEE